MSLRHRHHCPQSSSSSKKQDAAAFRLVLTQTEPTQKIVIAVSGGHNAIPLWEPAQFGDKPKSF
jgi:hypothetical protein